LKQDKIRQPKLNKLKFVLENFFTIKYKGIIKARNYQSQKESTNHNSAKSYKISVKICSISIKNVYIQQKKISTILKKLKINLNYPEIFELRPSDLFSIWIDSFSYLYRPQS